MKLAAIKAVETKACPAMPTSIHHEFSDGVFHKKLRPELINTNDSRNKPVLGRVKRTMRRLPRMERKAVCCRVKMPCTEKKTGMINQASSSTTTKNKIWPTSGL